MERAEAGETQRSIAKRFGVSHATIARLKGKVTTQPRVVK